MNDSRFIQLLVLWFVVLIYLEVATHYGDPSVLEMAIGLVAIFLRLALPVYLLFGIILEAIHRLA